jgi:hypothetical protein
MEGRCFLRSLPFVPDLFSEMSIRSSRYGNSLAALFIAGLVAGCASANPSPSLPGPEREAPPAAVEAPVVSGRSEWTISPDDQVGVYSSVTSMSVELASPTGIVRDTLSSQVEFALSISRSAGAPRFRGSITSMSTQAGSTIGSSLQPQQLPFTFSGRIENGKLLLEPVPGEPVSVLTDCSNAALAAIPAIGRIVVLPPLQLLRGASWTDSTTVSTCAGSIPVTLTLLRTYRILGEGSSGTILVERTDRSLSTGEGAQDQHRVTIRGDGTGSARLELDSRTGALVEAQGEGMTTVDVTSSGRTQRFTQRLREHVTRLK